MNVLGGGALIKGDSKQNLARLSFAQRKQSSAPVYVGCNPCSSPRLRGNGFETSVVRAWLQLPVLGPSGRALLEEASCSSLRNVSTACAPLRIHSSAYAGQGQAKTGDRWGQKPASNRVCPDLGDFPFFRHAVGDAGKSRVISERRETAWSTAGRILLNHKKCFIFFPEGSRKT